MKIYVDLDQVLVDFYAGAEKLLGYDFNSVIGTPKEAERNRILGTTPLFWEMLPPMPDYRVLWDYLLPLQPHVLSASPNWRDDYVHYGKRKWLVRYLGISGDRIHIVERKDKALYAQSQGQQNLLIDDHPGNIERFIERGGIGILHNDAHSTIAQLQNLGIGLT